MSGELFNSEYGLISLLCLSYESRSAGAGYTSEYYKVCDRVAAKPVAAVYSAGNFARSAT